MAFRKDFLWGAASAAPQIEGGWDEDGRTPSIWDELYPGHVRHNDSPHVACDTYHRFREDVALMKSLGLRSYRFSVSWSRVMPSDGTVNPAGLRYYSDLVDALLENGIEPMLTLYHWDLPLWLYRRGGWENPESARCFEAYASAVAKCLGDRVKWWMTVNEPSVFVGQGHILGAHAPFRKDDMITVCNITKNVLLAHGRAVAAIRGLVPDAKVGMALTGSARTPRDASDDAVREAKTATYEGNPSPRGIIWWADTAILKNPPDPLAQILNADDLELIGQKLDFFGNNIYQSKNYSDAVPGGNPAIYPGLPRTALNWPITPEVLYWQPKFQYERYRLPIIITENGICNADFVMLDGCVHDPQRSDFICRYLAQLKRAADENVPILGYEYWSILDNYEWAEGYDKRFGLIYVDYRTQKRIVKDSARVYSEIIRTNGESLPAPESAVF